MQLYLLFKQSITVMSELYLSFSVELNGYWLVFEAVT